jgi:hypothetical protein
MILTRDAGAALVGLAQDIASVARPQDHVVLVDDGSRDDTVAQMGRISARSGWGHGVTVTRIACATRGQGDLGIAANLALAAAQGDWLVTLPGSMRLDLAGFAATRGLLCSQGLDLLVCGKGLPAAHRLILHRRLLTPALRWQEGQQSHGDLAFVMRAELAAKRPRRVPHALCANRPETVPNMGFSAAAQTLISAFPGARGWISAQSSEWGLLPDADALTPWNIPAPRNIPEPLPSPSRVRAAKLRIACLGRHATRQPFAYAAMQPLWSDFAERTTEPETADLTIFAHPADVQVQTGLTPRRPLVLLSEESFWDSIFSPDPLASTVTLASPDGPVALHQRNHHNASIFQHQVFPYYLLTHHRFAVRYAARFARNAKLSRSDWLQAFANRPVRTVFVAARRPESFHDISVPAGNIMGLCAWRTRLAQQCRNVVERVGEGWPGNAGRFEARDWHLEKLVRFDGRALMISAIENTHQPNYLSEKLLDAFACGALPLFMASPLHRVHDLGLPETAWVNLWGLGAEQAAQVVDGMEAPGAEVCDAYARAQARLATLFCDNRLWLQERRRLASALRADLTELANLGPAAFSPNPPNHCVSHATAR